MSYQIDERLVFRFAKTMPEIPHEYVVRGPANWTPYAELYRAIEANGVEAEFQGHTYRYWAPGDGWKYWAMTPELAKSRIINRARDRS
jgi:hypothetical protein